jgi:hypothetical protein
VVRELDETNKRRVVVAVHNPVDLLQAVKQVVAPFPAGRHHP